MWLVYSDKNRCHWWTFEKTAICHATCNLKAWLPLSPEGSFVWTSALGDTATEISSSTRANRCYHFRRVQYKVYYRAYARFLAVDVLVPELVRALEILPYYNYNFHYFFLNYNCILSQYSSHCIFLSIFVPFARHMSNLFKSHFENISSLFNEQSLWNMLKSLKKTTNLLC